MGGSGGGWRAGVTYRSLGRRETSLAEEASRIGITVCPSMQLMGFSGGSDGKESACNAGNPGSIPGSGISPGEGNGNPLQNSCPENSMDGGDWRPTAHGVVKSQRRLNKSVMRNERFHLTRMQCFTGVQLKPFPPKCCLLQMVLDSFPK